MSERPTVAHLDLSKKQFLFLARKLGCFSKHPLLSIGVDADLVDEAATKGAQIFGIVDQLDRDPGENLSVGSPAGSISVAAHSMTRVLLSHTSVFENTSPTPESTIALANVLSCLKPRGRMVIPLHEPDGAEFGIWKDRLAGFPGRLTQRVMKTGLVDYFSLSFVMRGIHNIPVAIFTLDRKAVSRLEWHRLAREAVMQRMQQSNAAA